MEACDVVDWKKGLMVLEGFGEQECGKESTTGWWWKVQREDACGKLCINCSKWQIKGAALF